MEKKQILERLDATIKMVDGLPKEAFDYSRMVSKQDPETGCGTVCCALGWYPMWFPDSGLVWGPERQLYGPDRDQANLMGHVVDWHGLHRNLLNIMFNGEHKDVHLRADTLPVALGMIEARGKSIRGQINYASRAYGYKSPVIQVGLDNLRWAKKREVVEVMGFVRELVERDMLRDDMYA